MKWGTWGGQLKFRDGSQYGPGSNVTADINLGWYVTGDVATVGQLPTQGTAIYEGSTIGNVAALTGNTWTTYIATGGANMSWNFGPRTGTLNIVNFDPNRPGGGLNLTGTIAAPVQLAGNLNQFHGDLNVLGTAGTIGAANGAFVNAGTDIAKGAVGNWNAAIADNYRATGIFGMGRTNAAGIAFGH